MTKTMPVSMQLAITGVEEFQRIHKCYPESFYRTLALEYSRKNLKDLKVPGHKNCNYDEEEICLPNSLPIDIPLCKTRTLKEKMKTARCYLQALRLTEQELKNGIPGFGGRFLDDHPKLVVILFFGGRLVSHFIWWTFFGGRHI